MFSVVVSFLALSSSEALAAKIEKRSDDRCYGDLGCFSILGPFISDDRSISLFPESPEEINTRFKLYTRQDQTNTSSEFLVANDPESITNSNFRASRQTKIIVHGFTESLFAPWTLEMRDALLLNGDYNVLLVDWGSGAVRPYLQAAANTVIVGAEIARLINALQSQVQATPETFHIIGLSLGAHVAGYAGDRTPNLARISGLDPAGPYFDGMDPVSRLDPTDATFVDVIHTDAQNFIFQGLGTTQASGHVDFWVNGGNEQPGCDQLVSIKNLILLTIDSSQDEEVFSDCNHRRSTFYYTESINSFCPFQGYKCQDYQSFKNGLCLPCTKGECRFMGFHADLGKPPPVGDEESVSFYLDTGDSQPFCRYHYQIRVTLDASSSSAQEIKIYMNLIGENGELGERQLTSEYITIAPGQTYGFLVTSADDLGSLDGATFKWSSRRRLLNPSTWIPSPLVIDSIEIVTGETGLRYKFCGSGALIDDEILYMFSTMCY